MWHALELFSSYRLLLEWQARKMRLALPFIVVIQLFTGVGTVIGLGFFLPQIDPDTAMFFSTGGPTLTLITLGLVMLPQLLAQAKAQGTFDYMWSLPIPRMAYLAADITIWLIATLPGVIFALVVGSWRYSFSLQISPLVVPTFLLVVVTSTSIGYAMAQLSPTPDLVGVITNFIVFCLFLFSPINFPADRLPSWLADLHQMLPIKHAADVVRGTLTGGRVDGFSLMVLCAWCLVGLGSTYVVFSRRH